MTTQYILSAIAVMAILTYVIRVLPLTIFRRKIKSKFLNSFLYYIPYTVLAALTFPAIFESTGNALISMLATAVALILAYFDLGLVIVAIGAIIAAFLLGIVL
ncbi:MAG: AzlD domain-containing protein [Ruminococcaceae bacterium]|nr:AzlD domain-containing protein [Oscillospiraceae bacterium]